MESGIAKIFQGIFLTLQNTSKISDLVFYDFFFFGKLVQFGWLGMNPMLTLHPPLKSKVLKAKTFIVINQYNYKPIL